MDDDVEGAERELNSGDSPFHKVRIIHSYTSGDVVTWKQIGKGVVTFLRATLGFEQEIMSQGTW